MKKGLALAGVVGLVGLTVWLGTRFVGTEAVDAHWVGTPDTLTTVPVMEPLRVMYGFDVDRKRVVEGRVQRNQFLGDLLEDHGVPFEAIRTAVNRAEGVFDVRRFASNKPYAFITDPDSTLPAEQFVYEPSPFEYVVFNFVDSIYVSRVRRPVDTVEVISSGVIYSSLYETLMDSDALPQLVNTMADVYAWQVDFFHLQKGDRYKVVYEEYRIEGKPVGIGRILGAVFEHQNSPYYAVYYDQGQGDVYFDEEGGSLRKQFLKAPLDYTRISSRYSPRRFHPVQRRYKAHLGTDYAAPRNTPIRSVGDGVVIEAKYSQYNGNYVKIRHNSVYTTQYLHMNKIASGMKPGTRVRQGQEIGYVGKTGLATGYHLCYRFWKNGVQVDATKQELPASEPISEDHAAPYAIAKQAMLDRLAEIAYPSAPLETDTDEEEITDVETAPATSSVAPQAEPDDMP
ncbi:MAG TPA: peptidase M23 [Cytophagales bacterium]|nr:peptidase M23 [Cytophagales bacterium]